MPTDVILKADPDYSEVGAEVRCTSPRAMGFHMPAEWAPHDMTVMMFPARHNVSTYADNWYEAGCVTWAAAVRAVAEFEPVLVIAHEGEAGVARRYCGSDVEIIEMPIDDPWPRDTGPSILINGKGDRCAAGYVFNGYGNKGPHDRDKLFKARICRHLGLPIHPSPLVFEGGSITVDGEGTVITTKSCLLNANRNPGMTIGQVEDELKEQLGASKVIWLENGLNPRTDGHVDGICAFVGPATVMLQHADDEMPVQAEICRNARRVLETETDAKGRALTIIDLPLGKSKSTYHVNFYMPNGGVVVPTCGDQALNDRALGIIREAFPKRRVVGIEGAAIAGGGGGGIHCITQPVPAA